MLHSIGFPPAIRGRQICGKYGERRDPRRARRRKQAALRYILDALEEALHDGIEPEMLANPALFAALAGLVGISGEDALAKMTNGPSRRIHHGEFTLRRTAQ